MALGMLLKKSGARSRVLCGTDAVRLEFYPSYRAMARAVEKNGVAAPLPMMLFANLLLVACELGFVFAPWPVAAAVALVAAGTSGALARWNGLPVWPALFPPAGMALLAAAMVRSGLLAFFRGGVKWRGTFYSSKVVRAGARLGLVPSGKPD
jgi:hypothetical protein